MKQLILIILIIILLYLIYLLFKKQDINSKGELFINSENKYYLIDPYGVWYNGKWYPSNWYPFFWSSGGGSGYHRNMSQYFDNPISYKHSDGYGGSHRGARNYQRKAGGYGGRTFTSRGKK
jgi:hypothetical protein